MAPTLVWLVMFSRIATSFASRPAKRRQRAARQLEPGQRAQLLLRGDEHRRVESARGRLVYERLQGGEPFLLHQKRERLVAGGQRAFDHLSRFGDEDALLRLELVAQLHLGQARIRVKAGVVQVVDADDGHGGSFSWRSDAKGMGQKVRTDAASGGGRGSARCVRAGTAGVSARRGRRAPLRRPRRRYPAYQPAPFRRRCRNQARKHR